MNQTGEVFIVFGDTRLHPKHFIAKGAPVEQSDSKRSEEDERAYLKFS